MQLRERFKVAKYYAERLVRTETNHFNNKADALAYKEMGVKEYVFVAVLDSRTSEICQSYGNKVFKYSEKKEGINYPPLHPNCRSTTRGYLGEEAEKELKRRARNPITGKSELIDNIGYREWIEKKIKDHGKEEINKSYKMVKNKASDMLQYERYSKRLVNSPYLPRRVEDFIKVKYNNDTGNYKKLNREYKTIGKINKKSDNIERDTLTYYEFRKENLEVTQHFIYDYHDIMYDGKGNMKYDFSKIINVSKMNPNYFDDDTNRNVRSYDKIILISEVDTNEMVSMRYGRNKKTWKKI